MSADTPANGTVLWRFPPGRYHWLRMCSGGAGRRNRRVTLTDAQFAALADQAVCRCALSVQAKAKTREVFR